MEKQKRIRWEEMKKAFPDEWLMIVDCEDDKSGYLISGVVERHSKEKDDVYFPSPNKDCALLYTGESTFPGGLRSYAYRHGL